jgi:hypothetical protein
MLHVPGPLIARHVFGLRDQLFALRRVVDAGERLQESQPILWRRTTFAVTGAC